MHFSYSRLRLTALLLPFAALACDGDDVSGPVGSLEITSLTSGVDPDPDGYVVMLDGRGIATLGVTGSALVPDVTPGDHQVDLSGVAANCLVEGERPRTVTVTERSALVASYEAPASRSLLHSERRCQRGW